MTGTWSCTEGEANTDAKAGEEEDLLEYDLDEEETELASMFSAIAVFYSQKSYSPQYLFPTCKTHGAYLN
jgi:hypothetical protein